LLDKDSDIYKEYSSLYEAILKSLQCDSLQKNFTQLDDNFFYTIFNPIQQYSLEVNIYKIIDKSKIKIDYHARDIFMNVCN
jgi:hypothetical protein